MRRDQRKDLYRTERDSLKEPHEEAEIQRKALRCGKNLAFSKDTCLGKSTVKGDPKKSWSWIETEMRADKEEVGLQVSLMGIHCEEGGLTFARIERKTPVLRPALQSKQSSLCGLHRSRDQGGGGSNGQIVSVEKAADGRRQRSGNIIIE